MLPLCAACNFAGKLFLSYNGWRSGRSFSSRHAMSIDICLLSSLIWSFVVTIFFNFWRRRGLGDNELDK